MHFDNESHSRMQISLSLTTLTLNGGNFVFREQYARTTHSTALSADVIQNGCSARRVVHESCWNILYPQKLNDIDTLN